MMDFVQSRTIPAADSIAVRVIDGEGELVIVRIAVVLGRVPSILFRIRSLGHGTDYAARGSLRHCPRCLAGVVVGLNVHLD